MTEKERPEWYGGHDNPHHAGQHSHQRRILAAEDDLELATGKRGKQVKFPKGVQPKDILELVEGIEPST